MLPIALQLYTVRDRLRADLEGGLRQVAEAGYERVELADLFDLTPDAMRQACDRAGLSIVGWHTPLEALDTDMDPLLLATEALGCGYIVVPWIPPDMRDRAGYLATADRLNRLGVAATEAGLTLCYHHHSFEWEPLPGATGTDDARGIDILVNETDERYVQFELDLYWIAHARDEPMNWLERLAGRVPLLHVKDMAPGGDQRFCEVGTGVIEIDAAVQEAARCGVRHLIVEQDADWIGGDPFTSARLSLENLRRMAAHVV